MRKYIHNGNFPSAIVTISDSWLYATRLPFQSSMAIVSSTIPFSWERNAVIANLENCCTLRRQCIVLFKLGCNSCYQNFGIFYFLCTLFFHFDLTYPHQQFYFNKVARGIGNLRALSSQNSGYTPYANLPQSHANLISRNQNSLPYYLYNNPAAVNNPFSEHLATEHATKN